MNQEVPQIRESILNGIQAIQRLQEDHRKLRDPLYQAVKKLYKYGAKPPPNVDRLLDNWREKRASYDAKGTEILQAAKELFDQVERLRVIRTAEINVRISEFRKQISDHLLPVCGNDTVLANALPRFFPVILDLENQIAVMEFAASWEPVRYARTVLSDVDKPLPELFNLEKELAA